MEIECLDENKCVFDLEFTKMDMWFVKSWLGVLELEENGEWRMENGDRGLRMERIWPKQLSLAVGVIITPPQS